LEEEELNPSEPRYCVYDDMSWGTMVGCDNRPTCKKKWFHLSCIGLDEMPPRGIKWYCPDCRKKLKLGMQTNGLVERPMPPPPPPRVATSSSTGRLRVPPTVVAPTTVDPTDREVQPGETRPAKRRRRKQQ
jgi:ssDNA-binding Zn-finger/Zn-ribbon topoisomerase 1